jgi:hypothetical protein
MMCITDVMHIIIVVMKGSLLISPLGNGGGVLCGIAGVFCYSRKGLFERGHMRLQGRYRCMFVVEDEHVIASTLAATLKMDGFSETFVTCR